MFLWRSLKPFAVLSALSALHRRVAPVIAPPKTPQDKAAGGTPPLHLANPCDPNSLT